METVNSLNRQILYNTAKPILMNDKMVCAILAGKKTETRRLARNYSAAVIETCGSFWTAGRSKDGGEPCLARYSHIIPQTYREGDSLCVRETWRVAEADEKRHCVTFEYRADGAERTVYVTPEDGRYAHYAAMMDEERWRPSIHMPKEAARILLKITGVDLTRIRNMTEESAAREGAESLEDFARIWDSTVGPHELPIHGWEADPWVFTYRFEVLEIARSDKANQGRMSLRRGEFAASAAKRGSPGGEGALGYDEREKRGKQTQ